MYKTNLAFQFADAAQKNFRLFAVYIRIAADAEKAAKVARTINQRLGIEAYLDICRALASEDGEIPSRLLRTHQFLFHQNLYPLQGTIPSSLDELRKSEYRNQHE